MVIKANICLGPEEGIIDFLSDHLKVKSENRNIQAPKMRREYAWLGVESS